MGFLTGDMVVLLILVAVFLGYGMYFGKQRLISFILAFYPAVILYKLFPFTGKLLISSEGNWPVITEGLIFLGFFIALNLVIGRYVYASYEYEAGSKFFRMLGLSLAAITLVLLFSYTVVSLDGIHNFGGSIDALFTGESKIFWLNLLPLALAAFL